MLGKDPMKNKRKAKHNRAENTSDRHTDTERERIYWWDPVKDLHT